MIFCSHFTNADPRPGEITVLLKNTQLTTEPERKSGLSDFKSTDHFVVRVSHPSPTIFGAWAEKPHSQASSP